MTTSNLKYILSNFFAPKHIHIISERINPNYLNKFGLKNILRIFLYRFPSALVVQTENIKYWYKKNTLARNIKVINNPIKLITNKKNNYENNKKFKVLFVGRFSKQKGIDLLIDAFAKSLKDQDFLKITSYFFPIQSTYYLHLKA